jgi:hypothetical protein
MEDKPLTVCVLLYGDHPDLAHRCLSSIWSRLTDGAPLIYDIRLGLNEISANTRVVVDWFAEGVKTHLTIPVIKYDCRKNALKYPLMRRMLLNDSRRPAEWVMWFDDDSHLDGGRGWWREVMRKTVGGDMLGKIYMQGMSPRQWPWITQQAWYRASVGEPPKLRRKRPTFRFCTGGWWVIRSQILRDYDWPTPELRLIGGDAMLGELCRHRGYRLVDFCQGVKINAGNDGKHNSATCRGASPRSSGRNAVRLGMSKTDPVENQRFDCLRTELVNPHA